MFATLKVNNKDIGMRLMMLIMPIICVLLKTFNSYIWLAESLYSVNYVQPYVFQILDENVHNMADLRVYVYFLAGFN